MNDSAPYLSAVAALIGTFVGGITSIATSWLGQQRQTKEQRKAQEKDELQALYGQFIQDASESISTPWNTIRPSSPSSLTFTRRSIACAWCLRPTSLPRQTVHCVRSSKSMPKRTRHSLDSGNRLPMAFLDPLRALQRGVPRRADAVSIVSGQWSQIRLLPGGK